MGNGESKFYFNLGGSKLEMVTVMTDQYVKHGDTIVLSCAMATNIKRITFTWEKNGEKLECKQDKHTVKNSPTSCTLEIKNADLSDEARYTLTVTVGKDSASCSAMVFVELQKPWREVKWESKRSQSSNLSEQDKMISKLRELVTSNNMVNELRFLVCGRVGGGKSSTINTIKSVFARRQYINCLAGVAGTSHTTRYEKYAITDSNDQTLPFAFFDIMGLEKSVEGIQTDDILSCLKGHVQEGYVFNCNEKILEGNKYYISNPSLSEKMHCILYILPADKISLMENEFLEKINSIRKEGTRMGIPQVVLMTKVDCVCSLSENNLQSVYKSKKVKDKMEQCSNALGVPMNCIFPIQNYHEQTHMNDDINCLMLDALTQIARWANDYVQEFPNRQHD